MDTIFALATAQGKAGVSVIRVSGSDAFEAARLLCGDVPPPRKASLRVLRLVDGQRLDEGLVLTFEEHHSFTGERSVEFQCHGSIAVIAKLLGVLAEIPGFRLSEPGEFTRRALENNRLDLTQTEALADLIDAETEGQRQQAARVLAGELGRKADEWRSKLIRAAALLEATIDFADEDVPVDVTPEVRDLIVAVQSQLETEIKGYASAERVRIGFEVAIVGPPNVGKSTLLNFLAGREAAITSQHAGTTRDVIEVRMDLGGLPVTLLDTAGLRETSDEVEAMGINLAKKRADQADVRVVLLEEGSTPEIDIRDGDLVYVSKGDCVVSSDVNVISGKTGLGVDGLVRDLSDVLKARASGAGVAIRQRHKDAMERGLSSLNVALDLVDNGADCAEFCAEEIRSAVRALDSLIGRVDVENVLDEIFASFCLGK